MLNNPSPTLLGILSRQQARGELLHNRLIASDVAFPSLIPPRPLAGLMATYPLADLVDHLVVPSEGWGEGLK